MDWKKIGYKLLFPPVWLMACLVAGCTGALIWIFMNGLDQSPIAYGAYVLAFYALCVVCIYLATVLPKQIQTLKQRVYDNPIGNRYMTDAAFRTHISLYTALGINLLYALINALSYFLYGSMWFTVLAVYYGILAVMRFLLVRYVRRNGIGKNRLGELKSSVMCSCILLSVNFALSGAVLMILYQSKGFQYHGFLIYVMAAYTFYVTTHAIIDLVKYRKYSSPVMTTTKVIALSAALVSMLSLETAMFSQFGQDMSPDDQHLMIALTGAGVSIAVVTMSVYMIARSSREIKNIRSSQNGE